MMRRVILESPYGAIDQRDIDANVAYAKRCMLDCLHRGEAPIASHLLWTQPGLLDDASPRERELGLRAGWAWYGSGAPGIFFCDRGASPGMLKAADLCGWMGVPIECRLLDGEEAKEASLDAILAVRAAEDAGRERYRATYPVREVGQSWDDFVSAVRNSGAGRLILSIAERLGRR